MSSDSIPTRLPLVAGALAFLPVVWYGLQNPGISWIVSAVNVVLILAALVVAMGPTDGADARGNASA
jgi:uncharacterized membrane protein